VLTQFTTLRSTVPSSALPEEVPGGVIDLLPADCIDEILSGAHEQCVLSSGNVVDDVHPFTLMQEGLMEIDRPAAWLLSSSNIRNINKFRLYRPLIVTVL
jgi:hypothetical protein